ncbi:MAG: hypothetical protein K0Q73_8346 [Paenibacillus sp.]|nr:hypothetical protein [Paenibacillus sp.]
MDESHLLQMLYAMQDYVYSWLDRAKMLYPVQD